MKKNSHLGPVEFHPFGCFLPTNARSLILGSFPIAKFTSLDRKKKFKEGEIDFFYGGEKNQLWKLLSLCFKRELGNKNQIVAFLNEKGIAFADIIKSCRRVGGGSLDSDLKNCEYFKELGDLILKSSITQVFFTSVKVQSLFKNKIGSVNGVKEILLISPSGGGIRQISKPFKKEFNKWRKKNPKNKISDFRVYIYLKIFSKYPK